MTNKLTMTLDTKMCAETALYMYEEYRKAMQPPLYRFLQFDEWLKDILKEKND